MATVSAPYASGTITSVSGTTVNLSGGAVAGWVGRCIRITSGSAYGQIRKIATYVSATQITVDYAWNLSPFSEFTEVEPVSGDGFVISHLIADIVDGTSVIADAGTLSYRFVGASTFSGGAFLYAANARVELTSSSIAAGSPTTEATRCAFRFGDIDQYGNTFNGCFLTDFATGPSGWGTGSASARDPDFHFYAGTIRCTGAAPFWRFHSEANCTVRMVGLNVDGNIGGRIIGSKTALRDWTVVNMTSASGPFNPKSPIGQIKNIKVAKSLQAIYQYWPDSLTVSAEGIIVDSTVTKLARFANVGTSGQTFTLIDLDIATVQALTYLYTNSTSGQNNTFRLSQYIDARYVQPNGTLVTDSTRIVVRDNVPTAVYDSTVTTGILPRQTVRYRDMTINTLGDITWAAAGGTTYAPYEIAAISYLYQPISGALPLIKSQNVSLVALADSYVSQTTRATVDAYATIETLDKLYDRAKAWTVDNLSSAIPSFGSQLATGNGTELNLGSLNLTIDATAASVFSVAGSTITIKASALSAGSKFATLRTTGALTLSNGATIWIPYTTGAGSFAPISITGLQAGSRVQIYDVTGAAELLNEVVAGTSYYGIFPFSGVRTVRARATKLGRVRWTATLSESSSGAFFEASQPECTVYSGNGVDGSTVTEFSADYPNVQVDLNDPDGTTSVQRLFAWACYNETSADGVRNFFGAITPEDSSNYRIDSTIVSLKLDNVTASPVILVGARLYRSDGATVIAATSGSIQIDPLKAYTANIGSVEASLGRIEPNTSLIPALL